MHRMLAVAAAVALLLSGVLSPHQGVAAARWQPATGAKWQIQYADATSLRLIRGVKIYDLDLFETTAGRIGRLHAKGIRVVCYVSAGSWEDWRPDKARFPKSAIGKPLDGWPHERWLDIRQRAVRRLIHDRLDLAQQKGCDAVDPDNVEAWDEGDTGFPISAADQLAFNTDLSKSAHARGMAIGLKNDVAQVDELVGRFDFAVNEECFENAGDCDALVPFIAAGKPVFQIEYVTRGHDAICTAARAYGFSTLFKTLDLGPEYAACPRTM